LDHSEEVGGELVVTGGDTAVVLQLGEEALDEVTLAVVEFAESIGHGAAIEAGGEIAGFGVDKTRSGSGSSQFEKL
jgi:hypothetical protein